MVDRGPTPKGGGQVTTHELADRPTCQVPEAAAFIGISERSMRRALMPGGDLEHLSLRVGHRQLVKTTALLALVGASPEMAEAAPASAALALAHPLPAKSIGASLA